MVVVFALLAAGVLFAVVVIALGRGALLDEDPPSDSHVLLPVRRLRAADVDALRFTVAPRGYRMDEVDTALDRIVRELTILGHELAERDGRIAELEERLLGPGRPKPT